MRAVKEDSTTGSSRIGCLSCVPEKVKVMLSFLAGASARASLGISSCTGAGVGSIGGVYGGGVGASVGCVCTGSACGADGAV